MTGKPWYQSSTVWINLIPVAILVLEEVITGGIVPEKYFLYLTVLLNILNRLRGSGTKITPLTFK